MCTISIIRLIIRIVEWIDDRSAATLPHIAQSLRPTKVIIPFDTAGLDHEKDVIIEIAVIITDGELQPVDEGIEYVIRTEKQVMDAMGEWCIKTHGVRRRPLTSTTVRRESLYRSSCSNPHRYVGIRLDASLYRLPAYL